MKAVSKKLMILYLSFLVIALIFIILYESEVLESGIWAEHKQSEFVMMTLMELISLGAAFLGLRLFKFKNVQKELVDREEAAMMKWGSIRLLILEIPLLADTLLYYLYMNTTFGYLAIILLLCLPFVFPTIERCLSETEG